MHIHRQKSSNTAHEEMDLGDSSHDVALVDQVTTDVTEIYSNMQLVYADDVKSGPATLKASATAISLIKDHVSNPELLSSLPVSLRPVFNTLVRELSSAEQHVREIDGLVSENYKVEQKPADKSFISSARRLVSSRDSSTKLRSNSGARQADYHARVKSHHLRQHHNVGSGGFEHQQGYHRARSLRENGGTHRRLNDGNGVACVDVDPIEHKENQCLRLASCAQNYNLYDLFVFLFGDDINFDTGSIDDNEKIKASDERDMSEKVQLSIILPDNVSFI